MQRIRGGNARKKKGKLTNETLYSLVGTRSVTPVVDEAEADDALVEAPAHIDGLHMAGTALETSNMFVGVRYVLGSTHCSTCHHELIYYQDRDLVQRGFTFRCRVCQTMTTVVQE